MAKSISLADLITEVDAHTGSWGESVHEWDEEAKVFHVYRKDEQLAWDVDLFLWEKYDANDEFLYPSLENWDDILKQTIAYDDFEQLDKAQVLSCLFGLHHRTRISDGLWTRMFDEGVTQKLLKQLLLIDTV